MPEGDRYVTDGALLRCDKGVLITPLTVLPRPSRVNGRFQANTLDCVPVVNIKPFGVCAITQGPCLPPMLFWTGAHPGGRTIGPGPAAPLLESSVCQCGLGGRIGITVLPVPGMPTVGSGGAGLEAEGAAYAQQEAARQQAQDDEAHALSGELKEAAGGLAVFGLVCLAVGLVFPPAAAVGAVALELSEAALVVGVAVDVAVAIDHPTQDNWVTVGGDALAIATGYVVGKVLVGPALGALARKLAQREALAAEAAAAQAAADKLAAEQTAAKAAADKLAAEQAAAKAAKAEVKAKAKVKAEAEAKARADAKAAQPTLPVKPSRTQPSGPRNLGAKPKGPVPEVPKNESPENKAAYKRQVESAETLSKEGYDTEHIPPSKIKGEKTADYKIEGKDFDNYAPSSSRPDNIWSNVKGKVDAGQTRRVLLNLDDAPNVTADQLRTLSVSKPIKGLEEIIVIKNGEITHLFP